jgi:cell division protein FtsA
LSGTILAVDIGSETVVAVVAKNDLNGNINTLGRGIQESTGISKGSIKDIEVAGKSIKLAIDEAKSSSTHQIDTTVVSISGANTKSVRSIGAVNLPNGQITKSEVNQVLQMALYNASIVPEYEVIHVLPIYFKVDDSDTVHNPLNMNGSRLEVSVYIVTAKRTSLINIRNAFKYANCEVDTFVLAGYMSSIATLISEQKKLGVCVADIGGSSTQIVVTKDMSVAYSSFLPVGSNNITKDLSIMLHTPLSSAEELKQKYGSLLTDTSANESNIRVKFPRIDDENHIQEKPLSTIQTIVHARVEETLVLIKEKLEKDGFLDQLSAGVIITGGMSEVDGLKELASNIFSNMPVKTANPFNIKNGYINFDDPKMATLCGLLIYSLSSEPQLELDSNKQLKKEYENKEVQEQPIINDAIEDSSEIDDEESAPLNKTADFLTPINKNDKNNLVTRFINWLDKMF